jgi:hypothetical protein
LLAVSALVVAGHTGGASSHPRWLTATDRAAAAAPRPAPSAPEPVATIDVGAAPPITAAGALSGTVTRQSTTVPTVAPPTTVAASTTLATNAPGGPLDTTTGSPPAPTPTATTGAGGAQPAANRPIPGGAQDAVPAAPAPPWATSVHTDASGFVTTNLGCASGTSASALGAFFAARIGPVMGMDYQHVYPLGDRRYLWLFQDMFIDESGAATQLSQSAFVHNAAMVQDGACFTLYTRGTPSKPGSFEQGTGESVASTWFWPMGGELVDGQLRVFWVEMHKDPDPGPGDGLGWHPAQTWLATYSAGSLARLDFRPAANAGASPIYGYAVASDGQYTYLFGNTFEQDLDREGGYGNGPHSATKVFLARVPDGRLDDDPEYFTANGWSDDATQAQPISQRYWVENPMQPRYLDGEWVAVTKVDGYWGEQLAVDVANEPWGPWTTTEVRDLTPRGGDALSNTYHAYLMPWLDASGRLVVSYSQNARNMLRDAWPHPERYRPAFTTADLIAPPPDEPATTVDTTTTLDPTGTDSASTDPSVPSSLAPVQRGDAPTSPTDAPTSSSVVTPTPTTVPASAGTTSPSTSTTATSTSPATGTTTTAGAPASTSTSTTPSSTAAPAPTITRASTSPDEVSSTSLDPAGTSTSSTSSTSP